MQSKKLKRLILPLTGGLGNQLFQLSAAIYMANGNDIFIEAKLGNPRVSEFNLPEIQSFELPKGIHMLDNIKENFLMKKSFGYLIRMSAQPKRLEGFKSIRLAIRFFATIIASITFRESLVIFTPFTEGFLRKRIRLRSALAIGYFQSYKWIQDKSVMEKLKLLKISKPGPDLDKFTRMASNNKILIVHVRLGDYKDAKGFGTLGPSYYSKALEYQFSKTNFSHIWAFSDEPDQAKKLIPKNYIEKITWINEVDKSTASTLELMRHGSAYIISNSTFSWWAANLTYNENPIVVAPKPWFQSAHVPDDLIPSGWERIDAR